MEMKRQLHVVNKDYYGHSLGSLVFDARGSHSVGGQTQTARHPAAGLPDLFGEGSLQTTGGGRDQRQGFVQMVQVSAEFLLHAAC